MKEGAFCKKHNGKLRDFVFCMKEECLERLTCRMCFTLDRIHQGHHIFMIEDELNTKDTKYLQRIFDISLIENKEKVRQTFGQQIEKIQAYSEEKLKAIYEMMKEKSKLQFISVKKKVNDLLNNSSGDQKIKQIRDKVNQMIYKGTNSQEEQEVKNMINNANNSVTKFKGTVDLIIKNLEHHSNE